VKGCAQADAGTYKSQKEHQSASVSADTTKALTARLTLVR